MKKRGLGQGLASLLGPQALQGGGEGFQEVYTSQIEANQSQPRRFFDEAEIGALGQSIQQNGLLQPILVRKKSDQSYEIIAGERRWRAAKSIGLDRLPVLVRDMSDEEVMVVALVENLQRENLSPLEEAQAYDRLLKTMSMTQEELATAVGKSRSHVANFCRLLTLSDHIKSLVEGGSLSVGHARALVGVEQGDGLADVMVEKKMSVREAELLVQGKKPQGLSSPKKEVPPSGFSRKNDNVNLSPEEKEEVGRIESFLCERVGHPVKIYIQKEAADVVFHLASRENLDDLLAKLNTIGV